VGGDRPDPTQHQPISPSTLYRRHSRVWFCRRGAAFDIFAHKTFVGKLFRGGKPLHAVFTLDQGRRVYEGSRSLEVSKVETTSGVYLRTPRAPASPDAQWAPGIVSAPYAPVMISPPRVSLVTLEWWRPPYEPVAMSPFRVLLLRWSGGGPPMYCLRPPVRNLSARWSRGRPLSCGGC
jgi:hypothetical protein